MESAPLNKAHEFGRKAIKCHMRGLFSEASNYHNKSANLLTELSTKLPNDSPVIRSLLEQQKYHIRQANLALLYKDISRRLTLAERKMAAGVQDAQVIARENVNGSEGKMQTDNMANKFDEADSLLEILMVGSQDKAEDCEEPPSLMVENEIENEIEIATESPRGNYAVRPKNPADVIEELQIVNTNLRSFVDQLLNELQEQRDENILLRRKILMLEANQNQIEENARAVREAAAASLQEIFEQLPVRPLPELVPLEAPPLLDL